MGNPSYPDEDGELVLRCQKGDPHAFEDLVRKYQQTILNLVYHYVGRRNDVEDAAQKIFVKVYFSLPKFDARRPFFPWLYRIAINQCYDELRKARRRRIHTFSDLSLEDVNSLEKLILQNDPPRRAEEGRPDLEELLRRVLDQLPRAQRTAVVLRDIEELPYTKMAQVLKCSEQAARLKVFRARARLKTLLEKALQKRGVIRRGE